MKTKLIPALILLIGSTTTFAGTDIRDQLKTGNTVTILGPSNENACDLSLSYSSTYGTLEVAILETAQGQLDLRCKGNSGLYQVFTSCDQLFNCSKIKEVDYEGCHMSDLTKIEILSASVALNETVTVTQPWERRDGQVLKVCSGSEEGTHRYHSP